MTSTYTLTTDTTISSLTVSASGTVSKNSDDFYFETVTYTKHFTSTAMVSVSSSPATSNGFYLNTVKPSLQQNTMTTAKYLVTTSATSSNIKNTRTTDSPSTSVLTSTYTFAKDASVFVHVSGPMSDVTDDFYSNTVKLTKHVMSTASIVGISSSPVTSNGFFLSTDTPSLQQNMTAKMYSASAKIQPTKSSQQSFMSSRANGSKGN